ncbi:MAG: hypothetical protein QM756_24595 [Polyangiaceae bacterium]
MSDRPSVFVLARDVVELLTTLLLTCAAFASDPASLERLELTGRNKNSGRSSGVGNELTRTVRARLSPPRSSLEISEALANLRPLAAVHTGPALPNEGFDKPSAAGTRRDPPRSRRKASRS